jgi:hypothetical protein
VHVHGALAPVQGRVRATGSSRTVAGTRRWGGEPAAARGGSPRALSRSRSQGRFAGARSRVVGIGAECSPAPEERDAAPDGMAGHSADRVRPPMAHGAPCSACDTRACDERPPLVLGLSGQG